MQTPKKSKIIITTISVAIPLVVALLILLPNRPSVDFNIHLLPPLHALLNATTSLFLLISLYAILNKKIALHKKANLMAVFLSTLFLVSYVVYHLFAKSTLFGDANHDGLLDEAEKSLAGNVRYAYYFLLFTHILLAAIVIPFVLYSLLYAFSNQVAKHKKLSKYTWGIWFYVSVTGVIVYAMIQKFY